MKKILAIVLFSALLFLGLVSCGTERKDGEETSGTGTRADSVIVLTDESGYVRPNKKTFSEEDQATLDYYYGEMLRKYPEFEVIPREMLVESIYRGETYRGVQYFDVSFEFCLGGMKTGWKCSFTIGSRIPEGEWSAGGDELFHQYYTSGLTEAQVQQARSMIYKQITDYIEINKLDSEGLAEDKLELYCGMSQEGRLHIHSEYIAKTTPQSPEQFWYEDHAHVFGTVYVDISFGKVTLTPSRVYTED